MVAERTGTIIDRGEALEDLKAWLGPAFARTETRASAGAFIDGCFRGPIVSRVGCLQRRPAWPPFRIQSLFGRSVWSADTLRPLVRDYAMAAVGDRDGALVVDETGYLKKWAHSVGVW